MREQTEIQHGGDILIVDDTPASLRLLGGILIDAGFKVRPAPSARLALAAATAMRPDLILLDINMPEVDGFGVCAAFKANPELRDVPIIFISSLSETFDKVKAFNAGGVDYITKPFQPEEVMARVRTHLALRRLTLDLERRYEELRELEVLRDNLTHMIVHDLRSPLTIVMGYLSLVQMKSGDFASDPVLLTNAVKSSRVMADMITSVLDVSRLESGQMPLDRQTHDLRAIARGAVQAVDDGSVGRPIGQRIPSAPVPVVCDGSLITRVMENLLGNALKFTPESGTITVTVLPGAVAGRARVEVADTGPGIPAEFLGSIFDKFSQGGSAAERHRHSSGLGLAFCRLAVEAHGGAIGVDSQFGSGSRFWFELPAGA